MRTTVPYKPVFHIHETKARQNDRLDFIFSSDINDWMTGKGAIERNRAKGNYIRKKRIWSKGNAKSVVAK